MLKEIAVTTEAIHQEVTGSCFKNTIKFPNGVEKRFIVDLGLIQEQEYDHYNDYLDFDPKNYDAIFITHNHNDHYGRVPKFYRDGGDCTIYTSIPTQELMKPALIDSCRIVRNRRKPRKNAKLYTVKELEKMIGDIGDISKYLPKKAKQRNIGLFSEEDLAKVFGKYSQTDNLISEALKTGVYIRDISNKIKNKKRQDKVFKALRKAFEQKASYLLKEKLKENREEEQEPLYEMEDVESVFMHTQGMPFYQKFSPFEGVDVTFLMNGHVVGAAMILIEIAYEGCESVNLLFTGDYCEENIFLDIPEIPKKILDLPIRIFCEATYGKMKSDEIKICFKENILKHLENPEGVVICPAFSFGRRQEGEYATKMWQNEGELSLEIPIIVDGNLGHNYDELFINNDNLGIKEEMKLFKPQNSHKASRENRSMYLNMNTNAIIFSSSGMGSYGPIQQYILSYIENPNALIHFMGYCAEGTLGHRLKNTVDGQPINIYGQMKIKRAKIEYTSEFSAHAKCDGLKKLLRKFNNIETIFINHGTIESKNEFGKYLIQDKDFIQNHFSEKSTSKIIVMDTQYMYRMKGSHIKSIPRGIR